MKTLTLVGLVLNMIGTALVWRFGLPRNDVNREGSGALLAYTGDTKMQRTAKCYDLVANAGMLLIFGGFVLQAVALYLPNGTRHP